MVATVLLSPDARPLPRAASLNRARQPATALLIAVICTVSAAPESLEQLVDSNRLGEARQKLGELVATSGNSPRTRFIEAMILYREGRHLDSLRILQRLLGPEQRDSGVYKLFGLNLIAARREADAEPFFRAAARLAPEDATAQYYLGMAELSLRRYPEAERLFRDVIRRKPSWVEAQTMLGLAIEQQSRGEAAVQAYRAAAALARSQGRPAIEPDLYLSRYLIGLGRFGEAATVLGGLVAAAPDHAEAHRLLGRALTETGETEKALIHLRRSVELEPLNRQARYALARILQRAGRTAEAEQEFRTLRQDGSTALPERR
jgi:Flp pilus assembly protein TadD